MRLIKSLYWILFIENELFEVFKDFHGIYLSDHPILKKILTRAARQTEFC